MKNSKEKSPAERGETFSVPNNGRHLRPGQKEGE
jgi:hypothetical protein